MNLENQALAGARRLAIEIRSLGAHRRRHERIGEQIEAYRRAGASDVQLHEPIEEHRRTGELLQLPARRVAARERLAAALAAQAKPDAPPEVDAEALAAQSDLQDIEQALIRASHDEARLVLAEHILSFSIVAGLANEAQLLERVADLASRAWQRHGVEVRTAPAMLAAARELQLSSPMAGTIRAATVMAAGTPAKAVMTEQQREAHERRIGEVVVQQLCSNGERFARSYPTWTPVREAELIARYRDRAEAWIASEKAR